MIPRICNSNTNKELKKTLNDGVEKAEESNKTNRHQNVEQARLQRLSVKAEENVGNFWSGHMLYYTRSNPTVSLFNKLVLQDF